MSSIIIKIFFNKKISRKQKMLLYEFLTIYISSGISEFIAKYINNFILRNITFAGLYIYIYIILNNLSLNDIIYLQQFNYVFINDYTEVAKNNLLEVIKRRLIQ